MIGVTLTVATIGSTLFNTYIHDTYNVHTHIHAHMLTYTNNEAICNLL